MKPKNIARIGGLAVAQQRGVSYMREIGARGGRAKLGYRQPTPVCESCGASRPHHNVRHRRKPKKLGNAELCDECFFWVKE